MQNYDPLIPGTHYTCVCMLKYSGVRCEVPPSISRTESTSETIVPGVEAISDSGNADGSCYPDWNGNAVGNCDYSNILDGDLDTLWQATSDENVFVVFDMKREVSITSFAIYPHKINIPANYFGPENFKLESGTTATGPWTSVYSTNDANPGAYWRHHIISPASSKARYYRLYVNYVDRGMGCSDGCKTFVSEMAFFEENPGIRGE